LQRLQEAGVDGLCTLGSIGEGRIYTAMDVIASGCWSRLVLGGCAASMT
jgi:hypothetical protein